MIVLPKNEIIMELKILSYTPQELKEIIKEVILEFGSHSYNKNESSDLIDSDKVAEIFNVSKGTVNNWRKKEIIKAYSIGRKRRYKLDEVYSALQLFKSNRKKI